MYVRRQCPGISFHAAKREIASYAGDPAKLEAMSGRIAAFRLACCFERLKRLGRFEEVMIDDPFDLGANVAVRLSDQEWTRRTLDATRIDRSNVERN